jgi:predicted dinucleotide-binding enzyme
MKVGILGTGDVGRALGTGFLSMGHEVRLGGRDAANDKARAWAASSGAKASSGTFFDTAAFGELLVLATLWSGTENALRLAGAANLQGKVIIDATNPLTFAPNSPPGLALGHTDSGGEQVQRWLPDSRVVKAFNIVGNADMIRPDFPGGPPTMFYCGNDPAAKRQVDEILKSFGWITSDIGSIEGARLLEPLCILWVIYGAKRKAWRHAFHMLTK